MEAPLPDDEPRRRLDETSIITGYGMTLEEFDARWRQTPTERLETTLERQARFHPIRLLRQYRADDVARVPQRGRTA